MSVILLILIVCLYFLPAILAVNGGHKNANAIIILNLFLGWTFVGWVGALVWANTKS